MINLLKEEIKQSANHKLLYSKRQKEDIVDHSKKKNSDLHMDEDYDSDDSDLDKKIRTAYVKENEVYIYTTPSWNE